MNKGKDLVKNTLIILLGKVSIQFISFLMLPLYTKVLSTSEYGIIDIILTYVSLFAPVVTMQLEMASFRFLIENRKNKKEQSIIITNVLITSLSALFLFSVIFNLIATVFNYKYIIYVILLVTTTSLSGILLQISRGKGNNIDYSIACVISGFLNILFNIIFLVYLKTGLIGMFLAQIIGNIISSIYLYIKLKLYNYFNKNNYSKNYVKKMLKYSLPLVPNGIIWWIINVSDRTLIKLLISNSANGIYAISNKFSSLFVNIYNIYNMSWTESVSLNIKNDKDEFISKTFNKSIKFFSLSCLLIITILPFIFDLLINKRFDEAYNYIPILMISTFFNIVASLLGGIYIALKETKKTMYTSLWAGILNILLNVAFIRAIGIYAAALSTLISFLLISFYRYLDINKKIKLKIDIKFILLFLCLYLIALFTYYSKILLLNIIMLLVVSIIFGLFNIDFILIVKNKILKKIKRK